MVTETARRVEVDQVQVQVHSNGRNGHSIPPTVPLEAEAGIKAPEAFTLTTSLELFFAQRPEIKERVEELDEASEEWMNAQLLGRNYTASIWEAQIRIAGEKLKATIERVRLPDSIESEIEEMTEKLRKEVGEEDMVAMQSFGQNEIFLGQKGKEGASGAFKKCLADQFVEEEIRRRNEARLKMIQDALRDKSEDVGNAWKKSKVLSHANSNFTVVVQRWQMPSVIKNKVSGLIQKPKSTPQTVLFAAS